MARIVINDLKESVELDRAALRNITGGKSRQRLSALPAYESSLFQKPAAFGLIKLAGFDFNPNSG